jgi:hypothetical protein
MDTERRSITRPDGRTIDFLVAGPPDGLPLVLHEGTPVGLVLYPPTVQAARIRGLRVIVAARPGDARRGRADRVPRARDDHGEHPHRGERGHVAGRPGDRG